MRFGIIGSGSWATALAKILTDSQHPIEWWIRNPDTISYIQRRRHNPHYLHTAYFNTALLNMSSDVAEIIQNADAIIIAVPSAYVRQTLEGLPRDAFANKKVISAVKGILPDCNELVNEFLVNYFSLDINDYFTILGPCHAEEVAAEKLSYLTFSGLDQVMCTTIASYFSNSYLNTIVNHDVIGVQYAAVLKNIYALGAGIAHGLEYGDNFLSVYIANCANEMTIFLKKLVEEHEIPCNQEIINYTSSVYLGDLLVTCYSLYSRNRMFGTMIGKGYSVKAAQLELNMVAEGYNASKCIHHTNTQVNASIPIIDTVYNVLWNHTSAHEAFKKLENVLV